MKIKPTDTSLINCHMKNELLKELINFLMICYVIPFCHITIEKSHNELALKCLNKLLFDGNLHNVRVFDY